MPSFIVKKAPGLTPDGSSLDAKIIMVTAPSAEAAKIQGANDLGCRVTEVTAEPYANSTWHHRQ